MKEESGLMGVEAGLFDRKIAAALQQEEEESRETTTPAENEAVGAVMQLFYLCNPGKDVTICRADLEAVLEQHLGRKEDVASVLRLLESDDEGPPPERFDFLSYWHGMERFFVEAGSWPHSSKEDSQEEGSAVQNEDVLSGMQRFRDGVLELCRNHEDCPEQRMSSQELLDLLHTIQANSQDPEYWQDVMRIIPNEDSFGLTLLEVAESVCVWLNDFLRDDSEEGERRTPPSPLPSQDGTEVFGVVPRLLPENVSSACNSPHLLCWRETFKGLCRGGAVPFEAGPEPWGRTPLVPELPRSAELMEIVSRAVGQSAVARSALSQLASVHDSLLRTVAIQEGELSTLRRSVDSLTDGTRHLEAELARAHEQLEDAREASVWPEEQKRRAEALERDLLDLKAQNQELEWLRTKTADADRERLDNKRRDRQWQDRCNQLEQAADTAEGQAQWMSGEVQRQAVRLSTAESQVLSLKQEAAAWRWRGMAQALCGFPTQLQDLAAVAAAIKQSRPKFTDEKGTEVDLAPEADASPAPLPDELGRNKTYEDLQAQVRNQQTELRRLRLARDELLAIDRLRPDAATEAEEQSPREVQAHQRNTFLSAQLRALLRHTHEVEQLLDHTHDERLGTGPSPDVKRRLSIQQVHEDDEAVFNELSQRLYTLEVQKADADKALMQLQAKAAEQDRQLREGQHRREVLQAELGAATSLGPEAIICRMSGAAKSKSKVNAKAEYYPMTDTSATSDTRSMSSGTQGGGAGGTVTGPPVDVPVDVSSFLTPVTGTLRSSPKGDANVPVRRVTAHRRA